MRPLILLALALPALPQGLSLTIAQQGTETLKAVSGQLIKSVGVASVDLCNPSDQPQVRPAGAVYDAVRRLGVSTISPQLAGPLLDRSKNRSKVQIAVDLLGLGSATTGVLGTTKAISMPNGVAAALTLVPIAVSLVTPIVTKRLPEDSVVRANLLNTDVGVAAHGCQERLILYLYHGNWDPKAATVP